MIEKCVYEYIDEKDGSKRCNFKPGLNNTCNQTNPNECSIIIRIKEYNFPSEQRSANCNVPENLAIRRY